MGAVKNMFGPSDSTKIEHTIESAISKIRKEFDEDFDTSKISGVLDNFLKKWTKIPEYDKLKKISRILWINPEIQMVLEMLWLSNKY